jgi:hypothetical protein
VAEIEKRRLQFGEWLHKAFEPITRGASLGGREWPLKRRVRIDVPDPGVDIADREAAESRFHANCQPVTVLVVEYLMRLRGADYGEGK